MTRVLSYSALEVGPVKRNFYETLRESLRPFKDLIKGQKVLDFGASNGLSAAALVELGARYVWGVEPDRQRVEKGTDFMARLGLSDRVKLSHVQDTRRLDARDSEFGFILANAVFEHIPSRELNTSANCGAFWPQTGRFSLTRRPTNTCRPTFILCICRSRTGSHHLLRTG